MRMYEITNGKLFSEKQFTEKQFRIDRINNSLKTTIQRNDNPAISRKAFYRKTFN